jgi:hypothetical protein
MAESDKSNCYREKAAEMLRQACRAETPPLRAMYASIAADWDLEADAIEGTLAADRPVTH